MIVTGSDTSDPAYPLKPWDIITRIGDTPIDNEGMIKVGDIRVRFQYLLQTVARQGVAPLTVVREGKEMKIDLPVFARRPMLVPDLEGSYPSYFVYGSPPWPARSQSAAPIARRSPTSNSSSSPRPFSRTNSPRAIPRPSRASSTRSTG
jgi:hypothetical protein